MCSRIPIVVLDPGHGGTSNAGGSASNGARGSNGLLEKEVVLDVARRVERQLTPSVDVLLTRHEDRNLPLAARARVARDAGATAFVSLHMNGWTDPHRDGTLALVARRAGPGSHELAAALAQAVAAEESTRNEGVTARDLGVLLPARHAPNTRACLLEMAFLTNPERARRFAAADCRERVAATVATVLRAQLGLRAATANQPAAAQDTGARVAVAMRQPSLDEIVQALDRIQGSSFGTYDNYRAQLVDATVFGRPVSGVRPEFLRKLQQGEQEARRRMEAGAAWGIQTVGGHRRNPSGRSWHTWGLAVDLNYASCPYVMHEAGEANLDRELGPVYHRIARFIMRRDSAIPSEITQGRRSRERTSRLYTRLEEESEAMCTYFDLLRDPAHLEAVIQVKNQDPPFDWRGYFGDDTQPSVRSVLRRIMADYVTLAGRSGPAVPGESYPQPRATGGGDRPFAGGGAARDPLSGFLSIRREIAEALSEQGLRWGAVDLGGQSGDIMHFDDGLGPLAANIARARTDAAR